MFIKYHGVNLMLKVLVIAPTMYFSDRGCHIRIYEESKALRDMGHELTLLTYHSGRDIGEIDTLRIWKTPWYGKLVAGPSFHFLYMDTMLFLRSLMVLKRHRFDMIHAHLHEGAFIASKLQDMCGGNIPYVFDAQGSLSGEMQAHGFVQKGSLSHRFWESLEHRINRRAPYIITSSGDLMQKMAGTARRKRIRCIADGVDINRFIPREDHPENGNKLIRLRGKLGIPKGRKVVIYLGGMDRYKGVYKLLESAKHVLKGSEDRKVHFLLMGYPGQEAAREKAERMGIGDHVTVLGRIGYFQAHKYLALGDVAAAPKLLGWGEANGKVLNYMGCGLPVVAFDHSINREMLGDHGIYARIGDADDLGDKILGILTDSDKGKRIGSALRNKAIADHTWSKAAQQ